MTRDPVRAAVLADRRRTGSVILGLAEWHDVQSDTLIAFIREAHAERASECRAVLDQLKTAWREADRRAKRGAKR